MGAYVLVSLLTGARPEELRALTWSHLDLDGAPTADPPVLPHARVWRSVRAGGDTKTRTSRRTVALPQRCVNALREHRHRQDAARRLAGHRWVDLDLVFATEVGTALDSANIRRDFRRIATAAELDAQQWTPRELRHSFVFTHYLLGDRSLATFKAFVIKDLSGSVIVHDRYQNYDSTALGTLVHQLCCAHLLRDLDDAAQVYPDAIWPVQIADALRQLIHHANLARDQGLPAIPADVRDTLLRRLRNGMLVGLSDTTTPGTRPGERKARLLLEVLRDRPAEVLRFAHDLRVPPTSNQAERDLRPPRSNRRSPGG